MSIPNDENPRRPGPDRLRLRLVSEKDKTGNPETVQSPFVDPPEGPKAPRRRASTFVAVSPREGERTPDPTGGRRRKQKAGSDVHDIVLRLYDIIQSANDKEAVRTSVYAALYNNATMSSKPLPPSSKNAEIEEVIAEIEGDADLSSEIEDRLKQQGARRRKTKKSKKRARKTRKYSRRR